MNPGNLVLLQAFNDLVKKATGGLLLKDIVPKKADGTNVYGEESLLMCEGGRERWREREGWRGSEGEGEREGTNV